MSVFPNLRITRKVAGCIFSIQSQSALISIPRQDLHTTGLVTSITVAATGTSIVATSAPGITAGIYGSGIASAAIPGISTIYIRSATPSNSSSNTHRHYPSQTSCSNPHSCERLLKIYSVGS